MVVLPLGLPNAQGTPVRSPGDPLSCPGIDDFGRPAPSACAGVTDPARRRHAWLQDRRLGQPPRRARDPECLRLDLERRAETIYVVARHVSSPGFSASFRHLGWVDVHYRPGSPKMIKGCGGRPFRGAEGRYTGTFEFHGERRFAEADYPWLDCGRCPKTPRGCWGASMGGGKARRCKRCRATG